MASALDVTCEMAECDVTEGWSPALSGYWQLARLHCPSDATRGLRGGILAGAEVLRLATREFSIAY